MKLCLFLLAALLTFRATADDWPQWRGLQRNGISSEKITTNWPGESPKVVWRANVGTGFSSVSVSDGRAYTMGNTDEKDTVWCLEASTGKELWRHTYEAALGPQYYEGGPGSTPTVHDGHVFTISKWGDIFCLDAAKGAVVWQRDLRKDGLKPNRWGFAGSPLIWHDYVIFNAGDFGTALDRKTGGIAWRTGTNATGYASPTLFKSAGEETVLIFAAKHLVAVDPTTGHELWRFPFETGWDTNNPDPITHGDDILLSSFTRGCVLLSVKQEKPQLVYDSKSLYNHLSPGILLGDYLYAFSGEAKRETDLRCLHLLTGEVKWTRKAPAFGSIICANGKLVVVSDKGELLIGAPSPEEFKIVARAQVLGGLCWTPPSLANGRLYARNAKGDLVCLDMKSTK